MVYIAFAMANYVMLLVALGWLALDAREGLAHSRLPPGLKIDGHNLVVGITEKFLPRSHQISPLSQQIAPPVCSLHRVWNFVGQRHLRYFVREVSCLCGPIFEAGPETVDCRHASDPFLQDMQ